jgi:hypothetical protein
MGAVRVLMVAEEHGAGRQLVRYRSWPVCWGPTLALGALCFIASAAAGLNRAWAAATLLGLAAVGLGLRLVLEWSTGTGAVCAAFGRLQPDEHVSPPRTPRPPDALWQPVERKYADRRQPDLDDPVDGESLASRDRQPL